MSATHHMQLRAFAASKGACRIVIKKGRRYTADYVPMRRAE
jgi:hypothetical protein